MAYLDDNGVDFKNLPDTSTPLNATNLNKIQTDLADYTDAKFTPVSSIPNTPSVGDTILYQHSGEDGPWLMRCMSWENISSIICAKWAILTATRKVFVPHTPIMVYTTPQNLTPQFSLPFYGKYDVSIYWAGSSEDGNRNLSLTLSYASPSIEISTLFILSTTGSVPEAFTLNRTFVVDPGMGLNKNVTVLSNAVSSSGHSPIGISYIEYSYIPRYILVPEV